MDRAYRAAKRAAAEDRTSNKRKRGESVPRTPAQSEEPAPPSAAPPSPPHKRQLFANAVQLCRHVKVRCARRNAACSHGDGGKLASAQHALLRRAPLTPPRAAPPAPPGSCCMPTTTCARR